MIVPKHDEIGIPVMKLLSSVDNMKLKDFVEPLVQHFKLKDSNDKGSRDQAKKMI